MTKDELSQTIAQSMKKLGFARIARPAIIDVFSTGNPVSFDIHSALKDFANSQGLNYQVEDDEDFIVFRSSDSKD